MIKLIDILEENREPSQGQYWIHKKSGQAWELNWLDKEDDEAVMVKSAGRPLTKRISMKSLLKNWELK